MIPGITKSSDHNNIKQPLKIPVNTRLGTYLAASVLRVLKEDRVRPELFFKSFFPISNVQAVPHIVIIPKTIFKNTNRIISKISL